MFRAIFEPFGTMIFKFLVNEKLNFQGIDTLFPKIIRVVGDYVDVSFDEEILLRSITCLANILSALRNRWQNKHRAHISTAEVSSHYVMILFI